MNKWARPFEWNRAPATRGRRRTATPANQYFAFLSYSHQDRAEADWLHGELERFKVPTSLTGKLTEHGVIPSRLTPIFRDRHELAASDDLGAEIREALEGSHCLVVLCSPAAAKSKWTNAEIELFKRLHPDGCVIAAVVAGEPFASEMKGREGEECLPPALRHKYDRRGRPLVARAEPLAADLRESGDGRRLGLLKIVAGMLGVGLDDLVQREQIRRQRRLATISGVSFLGMVAAIVLAVTAIEARDAARDQRREAEGLVAFMLGDLKDKLEPIGRLDALDGVGSRVLEYYSKQDASELSEAGLLQRSQALSLSAQVAYLRGDAETAQRLYREAMEGTAEAVRRNPEDPQRLYDHAQNIFWIGDIARKRGRSDEAAQAYGEYKRLADRMAALEPDNLRWRMEGAYGDLNIGIVLRNQRRFDEAARQFTSALATMEGVAAVDRSNAEYQQGLANLLGWAADAQRDRGDLNAAIRIRQRQILFLKDRMSAQRNVQLRERLVPAHQGLGILLTWTQGPDNGINELQLAVAEANRLIAIEPDNINWMGIGAQAQLELASTLLLSGKRVDAGVEVQRGCNLAAQVLARSPGPTWRRLQTACLATRSRLALASGANAEALSLAERSLASARAERSEDPTRDRYSVAAANRLVGDIHLRMGNRDAARAAWEAAIAQLPRNVAERPSEMNERAELLRRLGNGANALRLEARLDVMGYRGIM